MESRSGTRAGSKRRRVHHEPVYVHDEDLWLEDGNFIVAATDDESQEKVTYTFKCHRSLLAKQSIVFEDMLAIPPSTSAQDIYEGLPLMILPDRYADVKGLLHFLYDLRDIPRNDQDSWEIAKLHGAMKEIEGPLRLAVKYEFTQLCQRLGRAVESMWPKTLSDIDALQDRHRGHFPSTSLIAHYSKQLSECAASAISLGSDAHLPEIIPGALYILSCQLYDLTGSSTTSTWRHSEPQAQVVQNVESLMNILTPSRFAQFFAGRATLHSLSATLFDRVLPRVTYYVHYCCGKKEGHKDEESDEEVKRGGPKRTPCSPAIKAWWADVLPPPRCFEFPYDRGPPLPWEDTRPMGSANTFSDPLYTLSRLIDAITTDHYNKNICGNCRSFIGDSFHATRHYIWEQLPYIFSVKEKDTGVDTRCPDYLHDFFYDLDKLKKARVI